MKSTLLRLREIQHTLSMTGASIAEYMRLHPEEVVNLTVRQLAERTFSSPSSVIRVCRSVGYEGYRDFQKAIIFEIATSDLKAPHHETELSSDDSIADIIDKTIDKNVQSLEDTRTLISPDSVGRCVDLLRKAHTVLLFGIGSSFFVAEDAHLKFLRLNKPSSINSDWHAQLLQARNSTPDDLGIIFSYSGQTTEMIECQKALKVNGTPCIAITRYSPSPIADAADHRLYTAANESLFRNGAMSSRLAQLTVVDIFYTAFASTEYEHCMEQLRRTHIHKPHD